MLKYDGLFKMALKFRHRFWEDPAILGDNAFIGGQLYTDLTSRWVVFPSYGYENGPAQPGTILVYSWQSDAALWQSLDDNTKQEIALSDL